MMRALTVVAGLAVVGSTASADLMGIDLRTDAQWNADATAAINDGSNYVVVRMYAAFDGSTPALDEVLSVGHVNDPDGGFGLISDGFFQETTFGGDTAPQTGFFGFVPASEWDTYVSVGQIVADGGDTTTTDPSFAFLDQLGAGDSVDDFVQGGWFNNNPTNDQGAAEFNADTGLYETFLGQFTVKTDREFTTSGVGMTVTNSFLDGSLTVFTPMQDGGVATTEVSFVGIPSPGAAALFGVAGLAGVRRRR